MDTSISPKLKLLRLACQLASIFFSFSLATKEASGQDTVAQTLTAHPRMEYIKIRVGLPRVVRGPSPGIPDSKFTEIQLPGGAFRGFSASTTTYAIDGTTTWAMSGTAVPVLSPGAAGTYDASGQWLNHVERSGNILLGWVHCETGDAPGQGLKSISLVKSNDDGMTWEKLGQIITGKDPVTPGKVTGEGDCSVVNGRDGYYYAYCSRASDHALIVARAPVKDPGPGRWEKYFNGKWNEPGLGGNSTRLIANSAGLAQWISTGQTVGLGSVPGGTGIFFSSDHTTFTPLHEPLLPSNPGNWNRPDANELSSYFTILDADNGTNQLGNRWLLAYMYIQPNESFGKRYLVFRPIDISISSSPVNPQVGVLLARWYNPALHDRWSTTAPVPGDYNAYYLDARLGYLMTTADSARPSIQLEEYVKIQSGRPDHLLTQKDAEESRGYQHLRTAGWAYAQQEQDTQPLYECYSETEHTHFVSNNPNGDGKGKMVRLLGYPLIH